MKLLHQTRRPGRSCTEQREGRLVITLQFVNASAEVRDALVKRLVVSDDSLAESCAIALGVDNMLAMAAHFEALGERLHAARTLWALALTGTHGHRTEQR